MRRLEDVTDDEIVDAIASFGIDGCDVEDDYDAGPWLKYLERLGFTRTRDDDVVDLDDEFGDRFFALRERGRLVLTMAGHIAPSSREWGRRLAGKTADEIAKALRGET